MGHSQAEKAQSRERILKEAAGQIREAGLESVSVGTLMRSVNLTHGGFYGHFASRSDLLAQALERALCDGEAASRLATDTWGTPDFAASVRRYLSRKHRDSRRSGCAIAALASDVARADEDSRRVMEAHIDRCADRLAAAMGTPDEGKALFAVSALIGALLVSRVITDPKRSDAVLTAARQQLLALGGAASAGAAQAG
jgi:TetR/AcrR family transcriptional repressor of nem operon